MELFKDAAKNLNLYEVKAYVRKAQNVAMNLTEMESKVREATNNEPWGASSTLMAQIAAGTYNYREREEIIAFIFRRFTEKAANEWRQIYKSLQLLEYLLKNGSERIIDDVRANISLIQMLKSFHYIDLKGRDQGMSVRVKAKNLIAFLGDDNQIREERKKARQNAKKFGTAASVSSSGGGLYGNFGGDDESYTSRVVGDGGVFGARYGDTADEQQFDEYEVASSASPAAASAPAASTSASAAKSKPTAAVTKPKQDDLFGDLLDFDGPATTSSAPAATTNAGGADDDDDFDDFQAAPSTGTKPQQQQQSFFQAQTQSQPQQPLFQTQQSFQSFQTAQSFQAQPQSQPNYHVNSQQQQAQKLPAAPKADPFSGLFSTATSNSRKTTNTSNTPTTPSASSATPVASVTPTTQTNTNGNNNSNGGDIDLLSF
ncbi:hypothetical protein Cantr_03231 [Candida viswanathii]|uniref:ENTH domain-containing protein n=1 Tax=Candida viswanathii TaxID=5486 RepID=A0A367YP41_9ASCO|nr:hypothetical protein Cantr_03231 [Candida viswanathii]